MSTPATVRRLPLLGAPPPRQEEPATLIDKLLADQRDGTAVERFARRHDAGNLPADADRYRELVPLTAPRPGQQYAFEVDLDRCTGCKACVTGCHNMNGLDGGEVWRTVGLLHGGTAAAPVQQTVTTSCHHCLEPACLAGCPVEAYEKDPITGIVRHLDDQCIGCQYCVFMCPYDAPKFNRARGIVRKCDMCSDRLAHGEAPACVQACPNEAIRITVVDQSLAVETAQAAAFLPGAPSPEVTLPTTTYRTRKALPQNLLPADFYTVHREHGHPPLVAMLVLTQLSVGAFLVELLRQEWRAPNALEPFGVWVALALGLAALGASVLHLGRPLYAFRALLGLRTSWLSREILAFSAFAGLAGIYAVSLRLPIPDGVRQELLRVVGASGLGGVACSVMVYVATQRPAWRAHVTAFKFLGTTALLGCATVLALALVSGHGAPGVAHALELATAIKVAGELAVFRHLKDRRHTALKRTAMLMAGDLGRVTFARFACAVVGGLLLPALAATIEPSARVALAVVGALVFVLTLAGELCERHLFFVTASALKMPGGPS
jgi:formate dehydrogenase iron-sulfur subunit